MEDINIYEEIENVQDSKVKIKGMCDGILDLYKKYPEECSDLLKEINWIMNEFEEIENELENLKNEIH